MPAPLIPTRLGGYLIDVVILVVAIGLCWIPFFVLAGLLMESNGMSARLIELLLRIFGRVRPCDRDRVVARSVVHDQVLDQVMMANLLDTEQSWLLEPDGVYHRLQPGEPDEVHRGFRVARTHQHAAGLGDLEVHAARRARDVSVEQVFGMVDMPGEAFLAWLAAG